MKWLNCFKFLEICWSYEIKGKGTVRNIDFSSKTWKYSQHVLFQVLYIKTFFLCVIFGFNDRVYYQDITFFCFNFFFTLALQRFLRGLSGKGKGSVDSWPLWCGKEKSWRTAQIANVSESTGRSRVQCVDCRQAKRWREDPMRRSCHGWTRVSLKCHWGNSWFVEFLLSNQFLILT